MFTTTNSEMSTIKRCERLHFYRYVMLRGALGEKPKALTDGNDGHEWLEDWWLEKEDTRQPKDPKIRAMCHGYDARYSTVTVDGNDTGQSEFEVLGVEQVMSFTISENIRVALKLDGLVRTRADGKLWVLEHKTSGVDTAPGADYWTALRLDSQISTYVLACKVNGIDVEGVLYDVLNKPALKPLQATPVELRKYTKGKKDEPPRLYANQRDTDETEEEFYLRCLEAITADPERYYRREFVRRSQEELNEAAEEINVWANRALSNVASDPFLPVRNSTGCSRYGRLCEYFGACSGAQQIESYPLLQLRHQELPAEFQ